MAKKSKWSRDVLGKSRYFRRDDEGHLYFFGQKYWYPVDQAGARHILRWLSSYRLLEIIILAVTFILILRQSYLLSIIFFLIYIFLLDIVLRWRLLKWLSRDLTPREDLPSSAWKQYWSNEILLMDVPLLTCWLIVFIFLLGLGLYSTSHGNLLFGTLTIIFFMAASLTVIYRLVRIIGFKRSQSVGGT